AWSFTLGSAVVLPANLFEGSRNRRQYDITRDGKRFLASVPARRYRKVENKAHHVHGGLSESTEILRISNLEISLVLTRQKCGRNKILGRFGLDHNCGQRQRRNTDGATISNTTSVAAITDGVASCRHAGQGPGRIGGIPPGNCASLITPHE